jgi:hypothetical protein
MAGSTIPGAGLGIFKGVNRQVEDIVGTGDVMMFPIVDVSYHLQTLGKEILENGQIVTNPTIHYIWFGPEMGMQQETAHPYVNIEYVSAFAPGLDAAFNCHLGLPNVEKQMPFYDTVGLHRSKDPGVGDLHPTTSVIPMSRTRFQQEGSFSSFTVIGGSQVEKKPLVSFPCRGTTRMPSSWCATLKISSKTSKNITE